MFYTVRLIDGTVIDFEGRCTNYEQTGNFIHFTDGTEGPVLGSINADCVKYIICDDCLDSIQDTEDEIDDID